jgi:hypothetical protein
MTTSRERPSPPPLAAVDAEGYYCCSLCGQRVIHYSLPGMKASLLCACCGVFWMESDVVSNLPGCWDDGGVPCGETLAPNVVIDLDLLVCVLGEGHADNQDDPVHISIDGWKWRQRSGSQTTRSDSPATDAARC